jgi:pteridine reductase
MKLSGRVVLITGAARRLGRAVAVAAAARGAHVAVHYRSSGESARDLLAQLRGMGIASKAFRADLASSGEPERLGARVERDLGPVAGLVNSASVYVKTPLGEFTAREWDRILAVNLRAPALLSRTVGLGMKSRGEGAIVNLGDWSIPRPYTGYAAYAASKAGLEALTRVLARELGPQVRVNMVSPGAILLPEGAGPEYAKSVARASVMGRMGTPEEIAEAVLFLLEGAGYTTGCNLLVDGGRSLS